VSKSSWTILLMGVICCVVLAVMLQYYLQQSPPVRLRDGLEQEFHITDVSVSKSPEGDGYTVTYSCDPGLAEKPRTLNRNMREVAEFVKSRMRVQRVRVIARTSETQSHKLVYPPETPPLQRQPMRAEPSSCRPTSGRSFTTDYTDSDGFHESGITLLSTEAFFSLC